MTVPLELYNRIKAMGETGDTRPDWIRRTVERAEAFDRISEKVSELCKFIVWLWEERESVETPGMGYGFADSLSDEAFKQLKEKASDLRWYDPKDELEPPELKEFV